MMTGRERVHRAITFAGIDRLPCDFPAPFPTDIAFVGMRPSPDSRRRNGTDEWGAVWESIGEMNLGEVKEFPLKTWDDFDTLPIPDINDPQRWAALPDQIAQAGNRFILGGGISIYERVHFLRGLENTWIDIYEEPERLCTLIDLLVDMNLQVIARYAEAGVHGIILLDDWGLQNRLMIAPETWREIWKPRYARIFQAAHDAGLLTFLHSCGYIVDILDDLIEVGLNVIHMDQQENMGLALLGERFGGRLTFYSPVDIQTAMHRSLDEVRDYCRQMATHLARCEGGFIPRWYGDPVGAGHTQEAVQTMCEEFLTISREMYGA